MGLHAGGTEEKKSSPAAIMWRDMNRLTVGSAVIGKLLASKCLLLLFGHAQLPITDTSGVVNFLKYSYLGLFHLKKTCAVA
jgi:hypothetical protein